LPAARFDDIAVTVTVPGAVELDSVAVSHGEFDVTVNGIGLPVPIWFTWKDCEAGFCAEPSPPMKLSIEDVSVSTGLLVTTSVTGIEVTSVDAEVPTVTVVV
jgi:hypothetical protein